jgi:hypothetical protein
MAEPISINEITNVKGDGDLYAGSSAGNGAATVIPVSNAAAYIQQAAAAHAQANKYVGELHEKRLNTVLDQMNDLDYKDAFAGDMNDIARNYAATMKDIGDNYGAITDPASDIQKYNEFRQRYASLKSQIAQSKAHNAILNENKKALLLHPELNTDENQQLINDFQQTPIDQRKDFLLKTPVSYDPTEAGKIASALTKQVSDKDVISKGGSYIVNTKGEYYDPEDFVNHYVNYSRNHIVNGKSDLDNLKTIYDRMPAEIKADKTFDEVVRENALANLPPSTKFVDIKPNQVNMEDKRLSEQRWEAKLQNALGYARLAQEDKALRANEIKPEEGAEAKYLTLYNALSGKGLNYEFGQNIYGSDPTQDITVKVGGDVARDANGDLIPGSFTPVTTQKVPQKQFLSATSDGQGGLRIELRENKLDSKTGALVSHPVVQTVNYNQAASDFNRIYGNKFTTQIASGSSTFNKRKLNTTNPLITDLDKYYNNGTPATPTPATAPTAAGAVPHRKKYNPTTHQFE